MSFIQGIIKVIVFHSEDTSYNILKIKITETDEVLDVFMMDDYMTITGYFPLPLRGEEMKFFGTFKDHPKYGRQYVVRNFEKLSDTSIPGLIEYLSSDLFKGIGLKTATNIVNELGKDSIKKIIEDKDILDTVPKLNDKLKETVYDSLLENKASENILIKLYSYGLTPKMAMKIYKHYKNETVAIIEKNPYQLIYDVEGIGFERADIIAKALGFAEEHPLRVKAMIVYLYNLMGVNYGHTFLYTEQLKEYLAKNLNKKSDLVSKEIIDKYLEELIEDRFFAEEDETITLHQIVNSRLNISKKVKELNDSFTDVVDHAQIDNHIDLFESLNSIEYTKLQRKAIHDALSSKLVIVTGGPGTGKTTVIKGIVFAYSKYHQIPILYDNALFDIKLIAPTGRAAKRMNETTNLHSETIHRFLGYSFDGKFIHNKDNMINAKMLIIDEASMIDIYLASQLFQSIPSDTVVVIVGDEDQLPSVGPGQVLKDLIDTELINTIKLNTIHRQASDSNIIKLARSMNSEMLPSDILKVYNDRYFVKERPENFQSRVIKIIEYLNGLKYDLHDDIQVLIPMYRGETGIDRTNKVIQEAFNQNTDKKLVHGDREFRIGDKVLQLSNQVEDNVMNGDQGEVIGIENNNTLIVSFFGNEVAYKIGDLINLKHAYAMSIHKSQGSEYKVVIMPVFRSYSIMLKRKLLYTGITRAKELLILIGDIDAFKYGVESIEHVRQTKLRDYIISEIMDEDKPKIVKEKTKYLIKDSSIPFEYLGEENMEGISPYTFMDE